jgi:hypothetical protein
LLERYPSIGQTEAAVLSAGCTLVPARLFLSVLSPSPLREVALAATGGSAALYLADQFLHQFRDARLVVLPGGVAYRLLAVSGVMPLGEDYKTEIDVEKPRYYPAFKRALDPALATISLPFAGPLFALSALGLRLEGRNPILIWTARRGQTGTPFQMVEFRIGEANRGEIRFGSTNKRDERVGPMSHLLSRMGFHRVPQL